jgi:hypothetical protein
VGRVGWFFLDYDIFIIKEINMKKEDIRKLVRESLLFEKPKDEETKGSEDKEEKDKEEEEKEVASDELTQLKSTLKPWKGNWAKVISCMDAGRFSNGNDATQRSIFAKIIDGGYKGEVADFDKDEYEKIISCMTKLGMGARKTS